MAKVTKRRGKWVVDYRVGVVRKTPSFGTRSEAEAFKREILLRPLDQMLNFYQSKAVVLAEAIQEYLDNVTSKKAPRTFEVDSRVLGKMNRRFGRTQISEITNRDLEVFQTELLKELGPASVNRYFNTIRHFFKKCENWGYLQDTPTRNLNNLSIERPKIRTWTDLELNQFLSVVPKWAIDIVIFVAMTGARRNEAVYLKWAQVDMDAKYVILKTRKGGRFAERELPLAPELFELLLRQINLRSRRLQKSEYVFVSENGECLSPSHLSTIVNRTVSMMNGEGLNLKSLRHTLLTRMVQADVNIEKVKQAAGHSNLRTTQGYLHTKGEDMRGAFEDLERKRKIIRSDFGS